MSTKIPKISVCNSVEIYSGMKKLACFDTLLICIYQFEETLTMWNA